ncbi:MAG: DUF6089 family protein [Bacteroidota bacterium]
MKYILSLLSLCVCLSFVNAQNLELGFWGGGSTYSGDLAPDDIGVYFETVNPAGGIFLRMNPGKALSLEFGLNLGKVDGEDGVTNDKGSRMLNFRTNITELALKANLHLFRLGDERRTQVVPYLMGGAGVFRFNPEANFDGNWIELQPLGTEAQGAPGFEEPYSLTNYAVLAGGGIKFIFKERFTIGLELGGRKTFTDFIDDVSGSPINYLDVLENNGSLAAQLSNPTITDPETENLDYTRGGDSEDWYYMGGVSFSFAFGGGSGINGRGIGCPTF